MEKTKYNKNSEKRQMTEEQKKARKDRKKKLKEERKAQKNEKKNSAKYISKKALERRVKQANCFLDDLIKDNLLTDDTRDIRLARLMKVFLIYEMDPDIEDKRKKGSDNSKWDKKIKDAKDIYNVSKEFSSATPLTFEIPETTRSRPKTD